MFVSDLAHVHAYPCSPTALAYGNGGRRRACVECQERTGGLSGSVQDGHAPAGAAQIRA